ncbi:MAG: phosphoribosylanthranilate isomerase [Bacteroidales bacterium]|nr:phosphoribosylanthranilate isomerase [Bacteroidales bacterium]
MNPIIQIAGIRSAEEAEMIITAGATHLGFPFKLEVHKEDLSEEAATGIIRNLPVHAKAVLITYLDRATEIVELMRKLGCRIVQLHGNISIDQLIALRRTYPEIVIWKSLIIHPENVQSIFITVKVLQPFVDAFVTDTFDPATGASGATGKVHDWNISSRIINSTKKPVILAGGLNSDNVAEAIKLTHPSGVDVHTGVEGNDGSKSVELLTSFVENARQAFESYC